MKWCQNSLIPLSGVICMELMHDAHNGYICHMLILHASHFINYAIFCTTQCYRVIPTTILMYYNCRPVFPEGRCCMPADSWWQTVPVLHVSPVWSCACWFKPQSNRCQTGSRCELPSSHTPFIPHSISNTLLSCSNKGLQGPTGLGAYLRSSWQGADKQYIKILPINL